MLNTLDLRELDDLISTEMKLLKKEKYDDIDINMNERYDNMSYVDEFLDEEKEELVEVKIKRKKKKKKVTRKKKISRVEPCTSEESCYYSFLEIETETKIDIKEEYNAFDCHSSSLLLQEPQYITDNDLELSVSCLLMSISVEAEYPDSFYEKLVSSTDIKECLKQLSIEQIHILKSVL